MSILRRSSRKARSLDDAANGRRLLFGLVSSVEFDKQEPPCMLQSTRTVLDKSSLMITRPKNEKISSSRWDSSCPDQRKSRRTSITRAIPKLPSRRTSIEIHPSRRTSIELKCSTDQSKTNESRSNSKTSRFLESMSRALPNLPFRRTSIERSHSNRRTSLEVFSLADLSLELVDSEDFVVEPSENRSHKQEDPCAQLPHLNASDKLAGLRQQEERKTCDNCAIAPPRRRKSSGDIFGRALPRLPRRRESREIEPSSQFTSTELLKSEDKLRETDSSGDFSVKLSGSDAQNEKESCCSLYAGSIQQAMKGICGDRQQRRDSIAPQPCGEGNPEITNVNDPPGLDQKCDAIAVTPQCYPPHVYMSRETLLALLWRSKQASSGDASPNPVKFSIPQEQSGECRRWSMLASLPSRRCSLQPTDQCSWFKEGHNAAPNAPGKSCRRWSLVSRP